MRPHHARLRAFAILGCPMADKTREALLAWLADVETNLAEREAAGGVNTFKGQWWLESTRDRLKEVLEGRPFSEDWS